MGDVFYWEKASLNHPTVSKTEKFSVTLSGKIDLQVLEKCSNPGFYLENRVPGVKNILLPDWILFSKTSTLQVFKTSTLNEFKAWKLPVIFSTEYREKRKEKLSKLFRLLYD